MAARRRVGVAGLKVKQEQKQAFERKGTELKEADIETVRHKHELHQRILSRRSSHS